MKKIPTFTLSILALSSSLCFTSCFDQEKDQASDVKKPSDENTTEFVTIETPVKAVVVDQDTYSLDDTNSDLINKLRQDLRQEREYSLALDKEVTEARQLIKDLEAVHGEASQAGELDHKKQARQIISLNHQLKASQLDSEKLSRRIAVLEKENKQRGELIKTYDEIVNKQHTTASSSYETLTLKHHKLRDRHRESTLYINTLETNLNHANAKVQKYKAQDYAGLQKKYDEACRSIDAWKVKHDLLAKNYAAINGRSAGANSHLVKIKKENQEYLLKIAQLQKRNTSLSGEYTASTKEYNALVKNYNTVVAELKALKHKKPRPQGVQPDVLKQHIKKLEYENRLLVDEKAKLLADKRAKKNTYDLAIKNLEKKLQVITTEKQGVAAQLKKLRSDYGYLKDDLKDVRAELRKYKDDD